MTKSRYLLKQHTLTELFTVVYVFIDDYLKAAQASGHFELPCSEQQKGSYSELMTIALVGDLLSQANVGLWFKLVKREYGELFALPDDTRYYRVLNNLERIWADFALVLSAQHKVLVYSVDSKSLPVCKFKRHKRPRAMTEATVGFSTQGAVYGFKLHAVTTPDGLVVKFAITPAHEADVTVARAIPSGPERALSLGDKAYLGSGIYTPPKTNALSRGVWTSLTSTTRKMIESVFSSLTRTKHLVLGQRNSFRSIRAHVCRKIAAHNFAALFIP